MTNGSRLGQGFLAECGPSGEHPRVRVDALIDALLDMEPFKDKITGQHGGTRWSAARGASRDSRYNERRDAWTLSRLDAEKWNDETARLLTSEGYDKSNGNGTRARWIDVNGIADVEAGRSGVLLMSNPANHNHPEHLRIWPVGQNGRAGDVFVNFNPAQDRDWRLEAGRTYGLKYRMFVYDGEISAERAERLWRDYADPPHVEVRLLVRP